MANYNFKKTYVITKCNHPAHSYVVGCKERGKAMTALTAQGRKIMCLFVALLWSPAPIRKGNGRPWL